MSIRVPTTADLAASATSLKLDTPAQARPGASITLTGTYQGNPVALDYNLGSGWIEAASVNFTNGIFSFSVSDNIQAGTYYPQVRDHTATTIASTAGTFIVSTWSPENLANSPGATAVFEFNANNPVLAAAGSTGIVGSVSNGVADGQSLTAKTGSAGNGIVIADGSGNDGTRRLLKFDATKISPNNADAATNWLDAGTGNSADAALIGLANSSDLATSGSFTAVIAMDVDKTYTYEAGPIWGSLATSGALQYAQIRENNGSNVQGAAITDSKNVSAAGSGTVTAGWHVLTMIKDGGFLNYRLDGQQIARTAITSTNAFTAQDFMLGGGFPPASSTSAGHENGVPAPYVGDFQAYRGVLGTNDLFNAEALAANSIGVTIKSTTPPPTPTIALSAPGTVQEASVGAGVTITETATTTNLTGTIYEEVLTATGAVETGYQAVVLGAGGQASFSVHLAKAGDTIKAVNSTTSPTATAISSAIVITDPGMAPVLTARLPSPLYTGTETITGTGGVSGLQLERITQGTYNTPGQTGWVTASVAADGTWSAQLSFTKAGMLAHVYAENGGSKTVVDLVDGTPLTPGSPAPAPTITVSAPGTLQEASIGTGITAHESITTANLSGTVYEEVLTASGNVETGYQPVALGADGTASFSAHMASSGDIIRVVDNTTSPKVSINSTPVTITEPSPLYGISLSAPGTVQETTVGAGVTINETLTTTGGLTTLYEEVLTSSGTVESGYKAITVGADGTGSFSVHLAASGDMIQAVDSITKPSVTAVSSAVTITDPPAGRSLGASLPSPLYTGTVTVTGVGGVAGLQLERITQGTYNTPGQSGWVSAKVAADGTWSAQLTFTKPGMLAHVYAENGGSRTVVDLVDGTPIVAPATSASAVTSLKTIASGMQGSIAIDMSAKSTTIASSKALLPSEPTHGSASAVASLNAQISVPSIQDHLKVSNQT